MRAYTKNTLELKIFYEHSEAGISYRFMLVYNKYVIVYALSSRTVHAKITSLCITIIAIFCVNLICVF